jgi:NADH-quinone oxidoreductase subunit L
MKSIYLIIILAPLIGAIVSGLFGSKIGRVGAHRLTIAGVAIACILSGYTFYQHVFTDLAAFDGTVYTWMVTDGIHFEVGFLVDNLTAMMMLVVTFVSLMVHIYTIGYMHDDNGYQRFFSYISLFTFSMLMLVMSNNFMQLFFGWEAVGLVSYLLIGFWYQKETAIFANMKAFLVNRVGDFGFLLGIALVLSYTGTLNYAEVFAQASSMAEQTITIIPGYEWSLVTVICILLFIGAMGKSAQMPLHVWLPDSMEGPTPISALIHAATMVTAGIFMVSRMSPLFELSEVALSFIIIIGASTALLMGLIGIVQYDIKKIVAYSTLSQLGYMTVALGVSAYSASLFHLMTHAFFKALLFLAAGSVIMAMHHEQDMRKMGGLKKYLPITYWTSLIGTLALIGFPGMSGFFSKDAIIEAVGHSQIPGAGFAYIAVLMGVFITTFYSFRMFFVVFHGKDNVDAHTKAHLKEPSWVIKGPLIMLAIPSVFIGMVSISPMLFGDFLSKEIFVLDSHNVLAEIGQTYHGVGSFVLHAFSGPAIYLAIAGFLSAAYLYLKNPAMATSLREKFATPVKILENKYGFDDFNNTVFAAGARNLGHALWKYGDKLIIDGLLVNGTANLIGRIANIARRIQTGYLYHYAFSIILGLLGIMTWMFVK